MFNLLGYQLLLGFEGGILLPDGLQGFLKEKGFQFGFYRIWVENVVEQVGHRQRDFHGKVRLEV